MAVTAAGLGLVEVGQIVVNGAHLRGDLTAAVTDCVVDRTITGASTVTLTCTDPSRTILRSPLTVARSVLALDGLAFELVSVAKSGDTLTLTFESLTVAVLRRNKTLTPAAAAGTTDRYSYARRILAGTGIGIFTPPSGAKTLAVLAQGTSQTPAEDKWTCLTRLATDVQDRCFESAGAIWFGPDPWLTSQPGAPTFQENTAGVDSIDFTFDVGQQLATASMPVVAANWSLPPGKPVKLLGVGPASMTWLISDISKSIYTAAATITLAVPQPSLPESASTGGLT